MNWGRFTYAAVLSCICALTFAACGSSGGATAAETNAAANSAVTGATGPVKPESTDKTSSSSDVSSKSASIKKTSPSASASKANARNSRVITRSEKAGVTSAFTKFVAALDHRDINYLCGTAYSSEMLKQLQAQGGCKTVTATQLAPINGYSAIIKRIQWVPGSDYAQVYATMKPKGLKARDSSTYFVKTSSGWKRVIYTLANAH